MIRIQDIRVDGFNGPVTKREYFNQGEGWSQTTKTYTLTERDFSRIKELLNEERGSKTMRASYDNQAQRYTLDGTNTLQITKNDSAVYIDKEVKGLIFKNLYSINTNVGKWKTMWHVFKWVFFHKK